MSGLSRKNILVRIMHMDDNTWAKHASPWSVWTRVVTGLPAIFLPLWSVHWIGWRAILPIAIGLLWIWLNPRLFPIPKHTDNWGSKVTFGERIWLNRKAIPIPKHHANWAFVLAGIGGISFLLALVGVYYQNILLTLTCAIISWMGKMWFCDRMVWLFEDMKNNDPKYLSWVR